jgi:hypothetical protein
MRNGFVDYDVQSIHLVAGWADSLARVQGGALDRAPAEIAGYNHLHIPLSLH